MRSGVWPFGLSGTLTVTFREYLALESECGPAASLQDAGVSGGGAMRL